MKWGVGVSLGVVGVIVACGGGESTVGSPGTDGGATSCKVEPAAACKSPFHVANAADVKGAAEGLGWQGAYQGTKDLGDDLVADADIELHAEDFVPPSSWCTSLPCRPTTFDGVRPESNGVAGASCVSRDGGAPDAGSPDACTTLAITKGTRFRMILVVSQPLPPYATFPIGRLVAPCVDTCDAGKLLCPTTHVCLSPSELCQSCEGHDTNYCSCRNDDCTMKAAGTSCSFISGDYGQNGTCTADKGCVLN